MAVSLRRCGYFAAGCLSNSRLHATTYDYTNEQPGMAGYEDFMQWIKG